MHIGSFCSLDTDDNGSISRSELRAAAETDEDCDGEISPAEMCSAVLHTGFTMFDLNHDGVLEWDEVKHFMERTLGRPVENQGVDELFSIYDKDGTGVITREAVRQRALQPKTCI
ncbi:hypothetical protein SARC_04242 [Sphaeroforma arctica JP610]|uniref:EF-hand domain-containing protein n=1 Tax=Sphaeroforma arctica JP610 TaxID=667725 RepID=A0A0L0G3V0_9EUKA|nr:hypothetical protein SARC_04242 [Sphaeroforma arctica JP610]KNC83511.1 hypothetical protein SARC_04242 [Sphaeroforma arctica JP610]|eukprot:XP_014157413.1 hypothetical protein SARC_04242 [Sphaeroforma arctica JP610]